MKNLDYEWRFWLMLIIISPFILAIEISCRIRDWKNNDSSYKSTI